MICRLLDLWNCLKNFRERIQSDKDTESDVSENILKIVLSSEVNVERDEEKGEDSNQMMKDTDEISSETKNSNSREEEELDLQEEELPAQSTDEEQSSSQKSSESDEEDMSASGQLGVEECGKKSNNPPKTYAKIDPNWSLGEEIKDDLFLYLNQLSDLSETAEELRKFLESEQPSVKTQNYYKTSKFIELANKGLFSRGKEKPRQFDLTEDDILQQKFQLFLINDPTSYSDKTIKMYTCYIFEGKIIKPKL